MFKNRSLQVKVVKDQDVTNDSAKTKSRLSAEEAEILKEMGKGMVKATIIMMTVSVVLHTAAEVILRATETNQDEEK